MKLSHTLIAACAISTLFSCIRKEPLNAECDIISASVPDSANILSRQPTIENDKVIFELKRGISVDSVAPSFILTPGATINPPSGTMVSVADVCTYTVTSEDRQWSKNYTIEFNLGNTINLDYDFENVRTVSAMGGQYDVFYEIGPTGNESMTWASGNPGFAFTMLGTTPDTYPTYQAESGRSGKCAALVTRSTGAFGAMGRKPLAAGNLFIGKFETQDALSKPKEATKFGTSFVNIPKFFTGVYKYTPGEEYCQADGGKLIPVPGKTDSFNIYAVFFESTPEMEMLNGTNVLSPDNENIIATAEFADDRRVPANDWTEFNLPFVYRKDANGNNKTIDLDKLLNGKYSITIVCTSSSDGADFSGAIGSTLLVDELSLICLTKDDL